ncbi:MAG: type II toxin-antitoxin system VapB family antitoxin [Actinomycetota bacterium]|nr:type II toxin-antitoxin system VapB family antitoxin [Actinomycetota bacterium]
MIRRTTIELDQELLERAKRAAGCKTARATVEEALRRMAGGSEAEREARAVRQLDYLARLETRVDPEVLVSDAMWR